MNKVIYGIMNALGYHHPLHPLLTHLVIGPVIATFVFALIGLSNKKQVYFNTARQLTVFSFVLSFFTAGMGIIDWIHFYGADTHLSPIIIKQTTAGILIIILLVTILLNYSLTRDSRLPVIFYGIAFLCVLVLGYFGAELVYGRQQPARAGGSQADQAVLQATITPDGYKQVEIQGFTLRWKVTGQNLDVSYSFATTGWIGVGFGQSGEMQGSSIVLGYVKNGTASLLDSFGQGQNQHEAKEKLGEKSTLINITGAVNNGVTTLGFTRPLNSGAKNDAALVPGEICAVIMAHGDNKAQDFISYHNGNRITFKITL